MKRMRAVASALALMLCTLLALGPTPAHADSYASISGSGSTWSANAIQQWIASVHQYGMTVSYNDNASTQGRQQFKDSVTDFGVSEIPYGTTEFGTRESPPKRGYAYMPIVAGGTAFMYNLKIGGKRVTNLRLSGDTVAKIFTGAIKNWNDRQIARDNPRLTLPSRKIIPVVRAEGSGSTAQFTLWMSKQHGSVWNAYCRRAGKPLPCGETSDFPVIPGTGFIAQQGSLGVSGYIRQDYSEGAIGYDEYSYALTSGFPVAKIQNASGYFTEPTASNVAVALTKARINTNKGSSEYLTQILDDVYTFNDPRVYPLSSYSYMILPTKLEAPLTQAKGKTLAAFGYYFLCQGQAQADPLGYSALPINLVQAGFDQLRKIPGAVAQSIDVKGCHNPTFSTDGTNTLVKNAPFPKKCDKVGDQCEDGTAGASNQPTKLSPAKNGGSAGGAGNGTSGGNGTGGTGSGGTTAGNGNATAGTSGGTAGASTAGGSSGAGGASGGAVDPDTGLATGDSTGTTGGDQDVTASAISVGAESFAGLRTWLMGLSALLLLAVVLAPPTIARRISGSGKGKRDERA